MKKPILFLAFALLVLTIDAQQKFMLGVLDPPKLTFTSPWTFDPANKTSNDTANINALKQVSDAYFNLILNGMLSTPSNSWSGLPQDMNDAKQQRNYYLGIVNECQLPNGEHLKTMVTDGMIWQDRYYTWLGWTPDQMFPNALLSDPNIYGVYVFDEPHFYDANNRFDLPSKGTWNTFFSSAAAPFNKCFVNLLPWYRGVQPMNDYLQYLQDYKTYFSTSPFLSFDLYPFLKNNIFDKTYFWHLSTLKAKALQSPVQELWATVHTMDNDGNRENENEQQLRFMTFCPIAYGAKGLQYWSFDNSATPPYQGLLQTPTKYFQVRKINKYISNVIGDIVVNNKNIATLHKNAIPSPLPDSSNIPDVGITDFPFNEKLENYQGIIKDVSADDILVGVFANQTTPCPDLPSPVSDTYLFIINKQTYSPSDLQNVTVTLRGNHSNQVYLYRGVDDCQRTLPPLDPSNPPPIIDCTLPNAVATSYNAVSDETTFIIPTLKPGEGRMVRVNAAAPKLTIASTQIGSSNQYSIYPVPALPAGNYTYHWFVNGVQQTTNTSPFTFTQDLCNSAAINLTVTYTDCSIDGRVVESELSNTILFLPSAPPHHGGEFPFPCGDEYRYNQHGGMVKTMGNSEAQTGHMAIYPNPSKGNFTVSLPNNSIGMSTVLVLDMQGRTILQHAQVAGTKLIHINQALAKGVYMVQVTNMATGSMEKRKLIVQ